MSGFEAPTGLRSTWPLLAAAVVLLGLGTASAAYRLSRPYPLTPWESAIVADAWRASHGLAVYSDPSTDHATHMYGPLVTWLSAGAFRFTGPGFYPPRLAALVATLITCAMLTHACTRGESTATRVAAFALFASCFFVARAAYAESRPDALSACFTAIALLALYRNFTTLGIAALVIAFFFKQTALVAAAVPAIALIIDRSWQDRRRVIAAVVLPMMMVVMLACVRWFAPAVWFYMVDVPAGFGFDLSKLPRAVGLLLLHSLATVLLVVTTRGPRRDPALTWIVATVLVTSLAGILAMTKRGGAENSLLPALLAGAALAASLLRTAAPRVLLCVAVLMVVQTIARPRVFAWAGRARHGDKAHEAMVKLARELPGRVICPDDPTIPLFAGRDPGRSLDCELDAVAQASVPASMVRDFENADYVIRVHATWDAHLRSHQLEAWGLRRVDRFPLPTGTYSLWKRDTPTTHQGD